ncbi:MAG TPA: hypothetical protein VJR46_13675 [Candidatus Dormibacteraeota bacterium]|nr:hypothetical protein [Candidatus Dormibacteraeota bacterium]
MRALLAALILATAAGCGSTTGPSSNKVTTTVRDLQQGQVVDGVPCLRNDLPARHIHVHLTVFLDGSEVTVPAGIGVGKPWGYNPPGFIATGGCFAWIHTHDATGVVHIFTEEGRTFTLGQLFEVWGRPLGAGHALGYTGPLAVLTGGRAFTGDPRSLALTPYEDIVLELGTPPATPPRPYDFGTMKA